MSDLPALESASPLVQAAEDLLSQALDRARQLTDGGKRIDDYQVLSERLAYAATEARAARELLQLGTRLAADGRSDTSFAAGAAAGAADLVRCLLDRLTPAVDDLGIGEAALTRAFPADRRVLLREVGSERVLRAVGRRVGETRGRNELPLEETLEQVRASVREFAEAEVAPHAERIHRGDETLPEAFIEKMSELGYFGLSIPEQYGGFEMGSLAMILTTEELSRASLAAAGSLITRPEILAKALLSGGTENQRETWLPRIASGGAGRPPQLGHQRSQILVHLCGSRRHPGPAGAHRPGSLEGRPRAFALHRSQGAHPRPRLRVCRAGRRPDVG
jgi:(2S)-methylsuccinyl-CoA dehydrogenase